MAESAGASRIQANAFTSSVRIRMSVTSIAIPSATGTMTDTLGSLPTASAAVTENTNTPMASPKVRHTIGSSRNRFSRGDRLLNAHCTTRNSSVKMMLTSPRMPKPTATSVSVTRVLATLASVVIRGNSTPSASPATAPSSCTSPARIRRRGRASLPNSMAGRRIAAAAR